MPRGPRRSATPGQGSWHSDIGLDPAAIVEGEPFRTTVGTFSTTDPDGSAAGAALVASFTYSLVSGTGSTDNGSFTITGDLLETAAVFDFEAKASYSIRVRSTDMGGLWVEKVFEIGVTGLNEAPTDISLSNSSLAENQPSGTTVGTLGATDPDAGDSFTYGLVAGSGDTDNASFTIASGTLRTAASFNYEAGSSYAIRIRATDSGGLFTEESFTIEVTNVNEAPTISDVSSQVIVVNGSAGPLAVTIGDPETDAAALTLVGASSNQALVPDANIVLAGSTASRTVSVTPVSDMTGTATITLTVGDGVLTATETFVLTVGIGQPPKVTTQPGSQTITEGRNATFTATGTGAPAPTVHWEVSTNRGKAWSDLINGTSVSGADTETLFLTAVTRGLSGNQYRAVFTNPNGTVASNAALLAVRAVPTTRPALIGTTMTLVSDENPSPDGALTLTATVTPMSGTGVPTGQVTFLEGAVVLGTVSLTGGSASLALSAESALPAGEHDLTARYGGDPTYNVSTAGTYRQVVGTTTTDVAITLSGAQAPGTSLPRITWTITAWNVGDEMASNVQVHMTLDNVLRLVAVRPATGITTIVNGRNVIVLLGDLPVGATTTIEVDAVFAKVPRSDVTIIGKATVTTASLDMNTSNDSSTSSVPISTLLVVAPAEPASPVVPPEIPMTTSAPRRRRVRRGRWMGQGHQVTGAGTAA